MSAVRRAVCCIAEAILGRLAAKMSLSVVHTVSQLLAFLGEDRCFVVNRIVDEFETTPRRQ